MGRIMSGLGTLALVGLAVAILRAFDYDIFAAVEWAASWAWETISRVADIWSNNDSFKEVTKKPAS